MENEILRCLLICIVLLFVELGGIYLGLVFQKRQDALKTKRFKFYETVNGVLKLNTCSGEVILISNGKQVEELHKGKKQPDAVATYDIIKTDNHYLITHTNTGYFTFLEF